MDSRENGHRKRSHIMHVARECGGVAAAGGVGDVVLQLSLQCVREGFDTTIVLPHYGEPDQETLNRIASRLASLLAGAEQERRGEPEFQFSVGMAYSDQPLRVEDVEIRTILLQGASTLRLALVCADRFVGKDKPYVYSLREAEEFASLDRENPETKLFCGAEPPPAGTPIEEGSGHFDYFAMNVLLQKAALELAARLELGHCIFHCHDAHTATLPTIAKKTATYAGLARCRYVVTAHNCGISYRQRCGDLGYVAAVTGLQPRDVYECVVDGEFDPLAAAGLYADYLTTVSDGYAWEVQGAWLDTSGGDSEILGLSEFLGRNNVTIRGITNGIAAEIKGPEAQWDDLEISTPPSDQFDWKSECKTRFIHGISRDGFSQRWGITPENRFGHLEAMPTDGCLFSFVGRWTSQKGVDIVVRASEELLRIHPEAGLVVFGEGNEPFLLRNLQALVEQFPGRVVVLKGFSERLAANIYAAGDFFLVPSRFEPCGLIDMIAQLNGNIPVVNQVGGLAKVADGVTGIGYFATHDRENLRGLVNSMRRALSLHANKPRLAQMQRAANRDVRDNYTWASVFSRFGQLYGLETAGTSPLLANPNASAAETADAEAAKAT